MKTEFRTTNRTYKYEGRKPGGASCCKSDDVSMLCSDCRPSAKEMKDNASVPAPKRLADAMQAASGKVATSAKGADNANGVPAAPRLADAIGGHR